MTDRQALIQMFIRAGLPFNREAGPGADLSLTRVSCDVDFLFRKDGSLLTVEVITGRGKL